MIGLLDRAWRRLAADRRGSVSIEFVLATPVVMALGGYGVEMSNYVYTNLQLSQVALALADNASRIGVNNGQQLFQLREGDLNDVLQGARLMSSGLDLVNKGRITLTSLELVQRSYSDSPSANDTAPVQRLHWQRCLGKRGGTADPGFDSSFGQATPLATAGTDATLANRGVNSSGMGTAPVVTAPSGAGAMFVEINYQYQPLFGSLYMAPRKVRAVATFVVRDRRDYTQIYNPQTALGTTPARATCNLYTT